MNDPKSSGGKILLLGILLGLLGNALLHPQPWGLNLLLWFLALWLIAALLVRRAQVGWAKTVIALTGLATLCIGGMVWRDSATLRSLDQAAAVLLLGICVWQVHGGLPGTASVSRWVVGILSGLAHIITGFLRLVFRDVNWQGESAQGWRRQLPAILTGTLLAIPFLALFTFLFASADARFHELFQKLLDWDFESVIDDAVMIVLCAAIGGGYLRAILFGRATPPPILITSPKSRTAVVEVTTALSLISLLFLTFVLVQLNSLFAGDALVRLNPDVTYSSNARRGFFELLTVSALVLPVLLGAHYLVADATNKRPVRHVSGVLLVLLGVIMASALQRMRLYVDNYGLTELRFYSSVCMIWLAGVFVWLALTVLRNHADRFCAGAALWCLIAVGGLHLINPDDFIVRVNLAQQQSGKQLDPEYLTRLSADAVPRLRKALDSLPVEAQTQVRAFLDARLSEAHSQWRTWNLARQRAQAELSLLR